MAFKALSIPEGGADPIEGVSPEAEVFNNTPQYVPEPEPEPQYDEPVGDYEGEEGYEPEQVSIYEDSDEDIHKLLAIEVLKTQGIDWDENAEAIFNDEDGGVKGLLNILSELKPDYSDPIVEEFNEYIAKGGDPRDWIDHYARVEKEFDFNSEYSLDTLYMFYKETTRWSDEKIRREVAKIETQEELDEIFEEIAPALEELKQERKKELEEQLYHQRLEEEREYRTFVNNVNNYVHSLDTNRELGIQLTQKDRKGFVKYFTEVQSDGYTQYQREIYSDPAVEVKLAMLAYKGAHKGELPKVINNEAVDKISSLLNKKQGGGNKQTGFKAIQI